MENIVLYGGSFNPPHKAHKIIADKLLDEFDKVFIVPCGVWKPSAKTMPMIHRMNMVKIAFKDVKTNIDYYDLERNIYTPTYLLNEKYEKMFPKAKIWVAIGEDSTANGRNKKSDIHQIWDYGDKIWNDLNWVIIKRQGYGANHKDLPPKHIELEIEEIKGSGTLIRRLINENKPISGLVDVEIENYIKKYELYKIGRT